MEGLARDNSPAVVDPVRATICLGEVMSLAELVIIKSCMYVVEDHVVLFLTRLCPSMLACSCASLAKRLSKTKLWYHYSLESLLTISKTLLCAARAGLVFAQLGASKECPCVLRGIPFLVKSNPFVAVVSLRPIRKKECVAERPYEVKQNFQRLPDDDDDVDPKV